MSPALTVGAGPALLPRAFCTVPLSPLCSAPRAKRVTVGVVGVASPSPSVPRPVYVTSASLRALSIRTLSLPLVPMRPLRGLCRDAWWGRQSERHRQRVASPSPVAPLVWRSVYPVSSYPTATLK
jgi:hypothetical protein